MWWNISSFSQPLSTWYSWFKQFCRIKLSSNMPHMCILFRKMLTNPSYQFRVISYTAIFYEINFNFPSFIHAQIKSDHLGISKNYSHHCYKPNSELSSLRSNSSFVCFHPLWPILPYIIMNLRAWICRINDNNNNNSEMNRPLSARFHYEYLSKSLRAKKLFVVIYPHISFYWLQFFSEKKICLYFLWGDINSFIQVSWKSNKTNWRIGSYDGLIQQNTTASA